jgi:uncharacterized membrane protein
MPEISAFCPGCGRSVTEPEALTVADTRDALLGGLAYATPLPAIVFLAVPALKSSRFVRFHSWQSLFFFAGGGAAAFLVRFLFAILSFLPMIGFLLAWLSIGITFIAIAVIWVVLLVKALQGQGYELPGIGGFASRLAG